VPHEGLCVGGDEPLKVLSRLSRADVQGKWSADAAFGQTRANLHFTLGLHVVIVDAESNLVKSLGRESFADQAMKETGRRQYHPHVIAPTQQLETLFMKPDSPRSTRARLVAPQKVVHGKRVHRPRLPAAVGARERRGVDDVT
jgi:hypothetical protein